MKEFAYSKTARTAPMSVSRNRTMRVCGNVESFCNTLLLASKQRDPPPHRKGAILLPRVGDSRVALCAGVALDVLVSKSRRNVAGELQASGVATESTGELPRFNASEGDMSGQ